MVIVNLFEVAGDMPCLRAPNCQSQSERLSFSLCLPFVTGSEIRQFSVDRKFCSQMVSTASKPGWKKSASHLYSPLNISALAFKPAVGIAVSWPAS